MHIPYYGENTDYSADAIPPEDKPDHKSSSDSEETLPETPDTTVH